MSTLVDAMNRKALSSPMKEASGPFPRREANPLRDIAPHKEDVLDHVADILMRLITEESAYGLSLKELFDTLEGGLIVKALRALNCHQKKTAEFLGLLPTTLGEKLKKHGIAIKANRTVSIGSGARRGKGRRLSSARVRLEREGGPDKDETRELPMKL